MGAISRSGSLVLALRLAICVGTALMMAGLVLASLYARVGGGNQIPAVIFPRSGAVFVRSAAHGQITAMNCRVQADLRKGEALLSYSGGAPNLVSPVSGRVAGCAVKEDDTVYTGQLVALILTETDDSEITAYLSSTPRAEVHAGQKVQIGVAGGQRPSIMAVAEQPPAVVLNREYEEAMLGARLVRAAGISRDLVALPLHVEDTGAGRALLQTNALPLHATLNGQEETCLASQIFPALHRLCFLGLKAKGDPSPLAGWQ